MRFTLHTHMKTLLISGTTQLQVDTIGDDQRDMKLILSAAIITILNIKCYNKYIKHILLLVKNFIIFSVVSKSPHYCSP